MRPLTIRTAAALVGAAALAWVSTAGAVRTVYSDDGISELSAPNHWSVRADIGRNATLRVSDTQADHHLAVYTYLPGEYEPTSLGKFAEDFADRLAASLEDARVSEAKKLTVNGRPAVQYEVAGRIGQERFVHQSTTVEGKEAKHQLVATVSAAAYARHGADLDKLIGSFRESTKKRPPKERIELAFGWPEAGTSAFTMYNTKTDRHGTHEMQMSGVTTLRPLNGEGLLISTRVDDFKVSPATKDEATNDYMQSLVRQATSQIPGYVVSRDGEFVRVDDLRGYHKRLEEALLNGLPDGAQEAKAAATALVKNMFTEETLQVSLQDGWNRHVQNWAGNSYAVGETYTYVSPYQMPALGDAVFPMRVSEKLAGRVPCNAADKANTCVKLVQTSTVAGPEVDRAMQAYLVRVFKQMAGDKAPEVAVDAFEVVKTLTLVTDPETLTPYESTESEAKHTRLRISGEKQNGEEVSETVTRYTY